MALIDWTKYRGALMGRISAGMSVSWPIRAAFQRLADVSFGP